MSDMNDCDRLETEMDELRVRLAACRVEVAGLNYRLRVTAQILVEAIGANGPANAEHLARIAAAEVARMREVSKEYIHALAVIRAENDRYRAALECCRFALEPFDDIKPRAWRTDYENLSRAHRSAKSALAIRTESGPLSDDSGPIAEAGK